MYSPPVDTSVEQAAPRGITVWQFPEWFVVQFEESTREGFRSRRLVHRRQLQKGRFIGPDKKKHGVVPIRFVGACIRGHVDDVDWYREHVLVTSANFTEAAQERNVEVGLLVRDPSLADALIAQLEALRRRGVLLRVPGL